MRNPGGALGRILERTRQRLMHSAEPSRPTELPIRSPHLARTSFASALVRPGRFNVIAEHKRRSPSRGVIREDLDLASVLSGYEAGGAAAVSVLTEPEFFGGSLDHLRIAREATVLPVLRKDFVIDRRQVLEAARLGADAVLLIAAALEDQELSGLLELCTEVGLDALVEVHDREELERALGAGARIVGVNNRDLRSLHVDLRTSLDLAPLIPDDVIAVAESGLSRAEDLRSLRNAGFDAFLIGESLMTAPDPGQALRELLLEADSLSGAGRRSSRVRVKICGIRTPEDAALAAEAGADAIGFVFWPRSPRAVLPEQARRAAAALPPFVTRVGVFVDTPIEAIEAIVREAGLDAVQLHGDERPEIVASLSQRAIKALRVGPGFDPRTASEFDAAGAAILLDTAGQAAPGGSGVSFDWSLARSVRSRVRQLVLAGGLTADNVEAAIAEVRPDAVDVSSGVESAPGQKDPAKLRAFVEAVRRAGRRRAPRDDRGERDERDRQGRDDRLDEKRSAQADSPGVRPEGQGR